MDERWFRVMFEASTVPIALADEQGLLVAANAAYCEMVGRPWHEIAGRSSREFTHPDDLGQHAAMETLMARAAACGQTLRLEKRYVHPDGTVRWGWVSASTVVLDGRSWTSAVIHDTTDRRTTEQALRIAATTDPLTGLLNRRGWREHLADLQRHQLQRHPPSSLVIAMIDMDRFKAYNDTHGHVAGDHLLATFAQHATDALGPDDLLARWGGEEFALALPGIDARSAHDALTRLAAVIPDGQTFSAGYTALRAGESLYDCFDRADMWLYRAKRDGGAQYLTEPAAPGTRTTTPRQKAATRNDRRERQSKRQ